MNGKRIRRFRTRTSIVWTMKLLVLDFDGTFNSSRKSKHNWFFPRRVRGSIDCIAACVCMSLSLSLSIALSLTLSFFLFLFHSAVCLCFSSCFLFYSIIIVIIFSVFSTAFVSTAKDEQINKWRIIQQTNGPFVYYVKYKFIHWLLLTHAVHELTQMHTIRNRDFLTYQNNNNYIIFDCSVQIVKIFLYLLFESQFLTHTQSNAHTNTLLFHQIRIEMFSLSLSFIFWCSCFCFVFWLFLSIYFNSLAPKNSWFYFAFVEICLAKLFDKWFDVTEQFKGKKTHTRL